jgi:hypothetical protein
MYFFDVRIESVSDMTEKNGAEVPGYSPETYICIHFPMLMVVFCFENMFTMRVSMMISIILYWAQTNKIILNGLFGYLDDFGSLCAILGCLFLHSSGTRCIVPSSGRVGKWR